MELSRELSLRIGRSLQDIRNIGRNLSRTNPRLIDCDQLVCLAMTYELVRAHPRHSMPNGLTLVASVNRQRKSCVKRMNGRRGWNLIAILFFSFLIFSKFFFESSKRWSFTLRSWKRSLYFREKGFRSGLSDVPIEFPRTAQRFYTECIQDLFFSFFLQNLIWAKNRKIVKFWFVDSS